MTIAEILLQDFEPEMAGTRRTLERIPASLSAFKPHEKSFLMGKLAVHVASLPLFGYYILTEPGMDLAKNNLPQPDREYTTLERLLEIFDTSVVKLRTALAATPDEEFAAIWPFTYGEYVISMTPRSLCYRTLFLNHIVHHRAQLGVYLRLNNLPVPGLYGPSADEPFNP